MTSYLILYFGVSVFLFMGLTMYFYTDGEDIRHYLLICLTWIIYLPLWLVVLLSVKIVERRLKNATGSHYFRAGFSKMFSNSFRIAFLKVLFMRKSKVETIWKKYKEEANEHQKKQREMIDNLKKKEEFAEDCG